MSGITVGLSWPAIISSHIYTALQERESEFYVEPNINKSLSKSKTKISPAFIGKTHLSESGFYCRLLLDIKSPWLIL